MGGCTLVLKLLVAASLTAVTGARVQGPGGAPPGPSVRGWVEPGESATTQAS